MSSAYIFQNQHNHFLSKANDWVDGTEAQKLLKTLFKDEALNIKAEQSVKNPELRLSIVSCELNSKGHPKLTLQEIQDSASSPEQDSASAPEEAELPTSGQTDEEGESLQAEL